MYQLPAHMHDIARFEERRTQLAEAARIELLVARILTTIRRADIAMAVVAGYHDRSERCPYGCEQFADRDSRCDQCNAEAAQPTMAWFDGPRRQPRDGRGRFLSKAWLAEAELYLRADRAWFRSPITSEER